MKNIFQLLKEYLTSTTDDEENDDYEFYFEDLKKPCFNEQYTLNDNNNIYINKEKAIICDTPNLYVGIYSDAKYQQNIDVFIQEDKRIPYYRGILSDTIICINDKLKKIPATNLNQNSEKGYIARNREDERNRDWNPCDPINYIENDIRNGIISLYDIHNINGEIDEQLGLIKLTSFCPNLSQNISFYELIVILTEFIDKFIKDETVAKEIFENLILTINKFIGYILTIRQNKWDEYQTFRDDYEDIYILNYSYTYHNTNLSDYKNDPNYKMYKKFFHDYRIYEEKKKEISKEMENQRLEACKVIDEKIKNYNSKKRKLTT